METWLLVSSVLLWLVLLFNLVLTLALVRRVNTFTRASSRIETGPPVNEQAPDFAATPLTGETVTLATYAGHAMTFLFVAPNCQPCHELLKTLSSQARDASSELTLVCNGTRQEAEALTRDLDLHLPLLLAPRTENPFFETYRIAATPSYCALDEQGIVRAKGIPGRDDRFWQKLVETWSKELEQAGYS